MATTLPSRPRERQGTSPPRHATPGLRALQSLRAAPIILALATWPLPCRAAVVGSGGWVVVHSGSREKTARVVLEEARKLVPELEKAFGGRFALPVTIVLLDRARGGEPAAPPELPPWAAGAVFPGERTVYLKTASALGGRPSDIRRTLAHELTHLHLKGRLGGKSLPRWFEEGLAMRQAGEPGLSRRLELTAAVVRGKVPSLYGLEESIGRGEDEARLGYAVAGSFVGFLERRGGPEALVGVLDAVRRGVGFPEAFRLSFGEELPAMEREWLGSLTRRSRWLAAALGGSTTWFLMAVLFALVSWRKRVVARRKLEAMDEEDLPPDGGRLH